MIKMDFDSVPIRKSCQHAYSIWLHLVTVQMTLTFVAI